jgi:hypothetical protein
MTRLVQTFPVFLALLSQPSLSAQNVPVDEGAFRVAVNGEVIGREDFSVRRVGRGNEARLILRATLELDLPAGRRSVTSAMEASGESLAVTAYQMKVTGSRTAEVYVTASGNRFLSKLISPEGEEVREYRAGPGSILLDQHLAHQYHLLQPFLGRTEAVSVSVLAPEAGTQSRMTLSMVGEEEVRIGTDLVRGRHYRLKGPEETREIWFDEQGRILRVAIPARGYLAERESLG